LRFDILDFAGTEDFNGSTTRNALGIEQLEKRNRDLPVAREARFTGDDETGGLVDRFKEGDGEFAGLLTGLFAGMRFPVGDAGAEDLIDGDLLRHLNFHFAG
jgi:hypothetical protein